MNSLITSNSALTSRANGRPQLTSFDSGYEHSFDHYFDVKLLVDEAQRETTELPATTVIS